MSKMPAPFYTDEGVTVYHGDCLDVLRGMADASVDAVVCDPQYGLAELPVNVVTAALTAWLTGDREHVPDGKGFMSRSWDAFVPPPAVWDECLRVLKPGGHLLAFAAPRTQDLAALSIRLAGFEIRDCIDHLFAQGFPKSLDVSKAIDRVRDDGLAIRRVTAWFASARKRSGVTFDRIDEEFGMVRMASHWATQGTAACVPTWEQWLRLRELIGFGDDMDTEVWRLNGRKGSPGEAWEQREVIGKRLTGINTGKGAVAYIDDGPNRDVTRPATNAARQWSGWGTALKPAHEPIVVARKPLAGTVAANVQAYGSGAINVDACRIEGSAENARKNKGGYLGYRGGNRPDMAYTGGEGRWPTNVVLSHAGNDEVGDLCADGCVPGCPVAELDAQSGITRSGVLAPHHNAMSGPNQAGRIKGTIGGDEGGASRFFPVFRYEAKAPTSERPKVDGVAHCTVKPLDLMRWLVRLVTPPGGTVLDPFAGSGTTAEACVVEGFNCITIEREAAYLPLIVARLSKPIQSTLFADLDGAA